ncbi:lysophospholipase [Archangium sp.]|uniref:alpha/beta hydrolase n=1 Tax=Archangium sp. TaxID=1872627 RepID=UPI002D2CC59B|nr:lysophospholipase [Archangium sp.]HYO58186.1 alpha/beta hydrolase [Archangium sp.]
MAIHHTEDTFEGAGGLRLFGQRWRPEGEPHAVLAIVHGFGEHSGRYQNVVGHLVPKGHAVYGFDLRGHGRSPGQRGHIGSWSEYREDVRAFLRWVSARESGRPVFLFGHSMGGLIVLDYALRHPEGLSGIIASGTPLNPGGVATPLLVATARILSRVWRTFPIHLKLAKGALSRDPAVVSAYLADPLVHSQTTVRFGTESLDTIEWVKAHASELRLPLLMVHGEADRINLVSGTRDFFEAVRVPDKKLFVVPGGHHEPHNDLGYELVLQELETRLAPRSA